MVVHDLLISIQLLRIVSSVLQHGGGVNLEKSAITLKYAMDAYKDFLNFRNNSFLCRILPNFQKMTFSCRIMRNYRVLKDFPFLTHNNVTYHILLAIFSIRLTLVSCCLHSPSCAGTNANVLNCLKLSFLSRERRRMQNNVTRGCGEWRIFARRMWSEIALFSIRSS